MTTVMEEDEERRIAIKLCTFGYLLQQPTREVKPDFLPPQDVLPGRPSAADFSKVVEIYLMVVRSEAPNITAAARILASREPGHSESATAARLRRKACEMPETRRMVEGALASIRSGDAALSKALAFERRLAEAESDIEARFAAYVSFAGTFAGAALATRLRDIVSEASAGRSSSPKTMDGQNPDKSDELNS